MDQVHTYSKSDHLPKSQHQPDHLCVGKASHRAREEICKAPNYSLCLKAFLCLSPSSPFALCLRGQPV